MINSLLQQLAEHKIKLSVVDHQLKVNAPKGAMTATLRQQLVDNKQGLIKLLDTHNQQLPGNNIPLEPVAFDSEVQASHAQQRLWFVSQFEEARVAYNINVTLSLKGKLDFPILQRCLQDIVHRHEVLRTSFEQCNGQIFQHVEEEVEIPIERLVAGKDQDLDSLIQQQVLQSFDLSKAPLLGVSLFKRCEDDYVLLLVLHHIIADGWSLGVIVNELAALYRAYLQNKTLRQEPLAIQYRDYAQWQRSRLAKGEFKRQLDYWQQKLADLPPLLELPTDKPRPVQQNFNGAILTFQLSPEKQAALQLLAKGQDASLFMVLLAIFQLLLSRYCNQQDIAVGTPVANRSRAELEPLIGMFVNTLVLRNNLEGGQHFIELLQQVKQSSLQAFDCQDVPFDHVVDVLQPERSTSYSPIFQAMFVLQNMPLKPLTLPGLELKPYQTQQTKSKFDITLGMEETSDGLSGSWEYNSDLFELATIDRMNGHFINLLNGILADPTEPIGELNMLSGEECQLLSTGWHTKIANFEQHQTIQQRFITQVRRHKDKTALSCEGSRLSYLSLEKASNRVANRLMALGVIPGDRVGLHFDRSMDLIVAMIAILKCGAAYVPLDPGNPSDRLNYIIQDSALKIIVSGRELSDELLQNKHAEQFVLVVDEAMMSSGDSSTPEIVVSLQQPAYIIYTSGSTGKPKGAVVTHANVGRLFDATQVDYRFNAQDIWSFFHSYAFDFSVWEIWGGLLYGGHVEIVPYWISRDTEAFYRLVSEKKVTVLNQTPSAFRQFIQQDQLQEGDLSQLRYVIFGGEALELDMLRPWFDRHGDQQPQLVNMYGITETTVHVTYRPIQGTDLAAKINVIGRPIADLRLFLFDPSMQLVPQGVAGEIYVAGPGLSNGYLRRPILTAERFVPNPFATKAGERLYRTGDVGCYLNDGQIEYLGRIDSQVKLRGFRIELGEIEAQIGRLPQVAEVIVLIKRIVEEPRLIAYVVPTNGMDAFDAEPVKRKLLQAIPEYMVPTSFIPLDNMPLTINGKIDQKALPEPNLSSALAGNYEPPQGELELAIAQIWQQVLKVEKVGASDNYFSLGGDSIRVIQIISQAKALGLNITVQQLFHNPSIRMLAQAISQLDQGEQGVEVTTPFSLVSAADKSLLDDKYEDAYPISALQEGIIYLSQLGQDDGLYHNVNSTKISGAFDQLCLRQSMQQVIARHSVLRTSFAYQGYSKPLQLVHREVNIPLEVYDITELSDEQQQFKLKAVFEQQRRTPFDLSVAPLFKIILYRLSSTQTQFIWVEHHAILDGWSVQSFINELLTTYRQRLNGEAIERKPLLSCYRDFVAAELHSMKDESSREFWRDYLADFRMTRLPRAGQSTEQKSLEKIADIRFGDETGNKLEQLAGQLGVSVKSVFLAVHAKIIATLTGDTRITLGIVSHGRVEQQDGDKVLGMFVSALPICISVSDISWSELIILLAEAERAIMPHRRFPLVELQTLCGGQQLTEILFNYTDFGKTGDDVKIAGFDFEVDDNKVANNFPFEINFSKDIISGQLSLGLNVAADICPGLDATELAGYYDKCLQDIVTDPNRHHANMSLLDAQQFQRMLFQWNDTFSDFEQQVCMHQMFEAQVARTPDAVAVVVGETELSYRALNEKANRLAHCLIAQGVGIDKLVGLSVERSLQMIVGILGILKAGGAYAPLESDYPSDRLTYILSDSDITLVLTQSWLVHKLPLTTQQVLCLDTEETEQHLGTFANSNPSPVALTASHLAYVIYTSGSTGKPKGVMLEHQGVVNRIEWMQRTYGLNASAKVLQKTPYSFDVSVWELAWPLWYGASLVFAQPGGHRDPDYLVAFIREEGITHLHFVPSMLAIFLQTPDVEQCHSIQQVFASGEALQLEHLRLFTEKLGGARLHNLYGPTEASIDVSYFACTGDHVEAGVPIGKPVDNTQLHILDDGLQPLPVGIAGELYIGGAQLARGYLNRPNLTEQSFINNPFYSQGHPSRRLYRTGDLARYRSDGTIEYIGRKDGQVKVRGFRIELGEIEHCLRSSKLVKDPIVLVKTDIVGDKSLAAYVILHSQQTEPAKEIIAELVAHLSAKLPEYMIPSDFIFAEVWPVTANGKIDRKALAQLQSEQVMLDHDLVAPETDNENRLLKIWKKLLKREPISTTSNFFSIGGHSLHAMRLNSRIRDEFNIQLALQQLFDAPTIRQLAQAIEQAGKHRLPEVKPVSRSTPLPLSFSQKRLWLIDQIEGESSHYHMPNALRLKGRLNQAAMQYALDTIVERHEVLRTNYRKMDDDVVQEIREPTSIDMKTIDLSTLAKPECESEFEGLLQADAIAPFDLSRDFMVRVALVKFSELEHAVLINMHHIAADGWSMAILTREFVTLYDSFCQGVDNPLPKLPVQYADYAQWQRKLLTGERFDRQLAYWQDRLNGIPLVHSLPLDKPRPAKLQFTGQTYQQMLDHSKLQVLNLSADQHGTTLFMLLQSAFALLLGRWSESTDIVIGSPIAGRPEKALESLIGCFLNTLAFRFQLSARQDFTGFLQQGKQHALAAYSHQDIPFELLVEKLKVKRSLAYSPVFQIWFVMQDNEQVSLQLPGLSVEGVGSGATTAQFDLQLSAAQSEKGLSLIWAYSNSLFEASTIKQLAQAFADLLHGIIESPDTPLYQLPMRDMQQIKQIRQQATKNKLLKKKFKIKTAEKASGE